MKKIFSIFALLMVMFISFESCRNEEVLGNTENNKKQLQLIKSKSLWKENEKFINSIYNHFEKSVVPDEISKNNFLNKYGNINWDYAMTFGAPSRNYLVAPVFKFGKIAGAIKAQVKNNMVIYSYTKDNDILEMFFDIIYTPRYKIKPKEVSVKGNNSTNRYNYSCEERSASVWLNEGSGETPHWGTRYYQSCSWEWTDDIVPTNPLMYNCEECGQGDGGSGGSDNTNQNTDPCAAIKAQNNNTNYNSKIAELDKSSVLNKKTETGYKESKSGNFTALTPSTSTSSSDGLNLSVDADTKGYVHSHVNDYETGKTNDNNEPEERQPIRMFSPADVNALMEMASYANGNYGDLYGTMVSSDGNYTIKFTGTAADIKTGFDTKQWRDDFKDYKIQHDRWSNEKLFLKFLSEKMNVKGISLYKIKSNGTVQNKTLDANNKVQSTDCPQ